MSKIKYFTWRQVGDDILKCIIVPTDYDNFPMNTKTGGSYAVAPARVLGLDYATYLRFVRDSFPEVVTIEGKGHRYPIDIWRRGQELYKFVDLLNLKLNLAMKETKNDSNN